jgi:hypothetical protein
MAGFRGTCRDSFSIVLNSELKKPWITPSVFESTGDDRIIDEYTLGQLLDRGTAESILRNHWESVSFSAPYSDYLSHYLG